MSIHIYLFLSFVYLYVLLITKAVHHFRHEAVALVRGFLRESESIERQARHTTTTTTTNNSDDDNELHNKQYNHKRASSVRLGSARMPRACPAPTRHY